MFSTYNQDAHFVDVYLDTTRLATIDDSNYTLCAGWLGSVPYRQGITFEQLEKEILPQHFPVSSWTWLDYHILVCGPIILLYFSHTHINFCIKI